MSNNPSQYRVHFKGGVAIGVCCYSFFEAYIIGINEMLKLGFEYEVDYIECIDTGEKAVDIEFKHKQIK